MHFSTKNSPWPGDGWVTDQRFMLSQDVPPGASQVVTVNITAPITPGLYTLGAQLVEEKARLQLQKKRLGHVKTSFLQY